MIRYVQAFMMVFLLVGCQSFKTTVPVPTTASALSPTATHTVTPPTVTHTVIPPTATVLPTPTQAEQIDIDEFHAFLESQAAEDMFSGTALIAKDGEPVLHEAYGMADREKAIPNNLDTKFNLGSMDKMFTAVAIMQLVEQGKISLQAKAGEYLPEYPNRKVIDAVTIHQLLTHTSGMSDYFENDKYLDVHDKIRSVSDYLPLFVDAPLLFEPGSQYSYSNSGFIVLGLVIEAVSGESYYDYVRTHIFEPVGMTNTACYEHDANTPNLAIGYTTLDRQFNDTGVLTDDSWFIPMRGGSAGGGYSTTSDLLAFANALIGNRLLSAESTRLLLKGKVKTQENNHYAYGFFDRVIAGHRMVGHGGGAPGTCSFLNIYPKIGYTFIALTNSDNGCRLVLDYLETSFLN